MVACDTSLSGFDFKKEYPMTNFRIPVEQNSFNNLVAEAFQVATIALVGVLGILTFAATI